jgi:hypothetical protein
LQVMNTREKDTQIESSDTILFQSVSFLPILSNVLCSDTLHVDPETPK